MVKAYMKSVEMMLVIIVSVFFLISIMGRQSEMRREELKDVLIKLEDNPEFRSFCTSNTGCFNSTDPNDADSLIRQYLSEDYGYYLCINNAPYDFPQTNIYGESIFFAGNHTDVSHDTVRLFYWLK